MVLENKELRKIPESYKNKFSLNEHHKLYCSFNIIIAIKSTENEVGEA
jgi:hypothetical protein